MKRDIDDDLSRPRAPSPATTTTSRTTPTATRTTPSRRRRSHDEHAEREVRHILARVFGM
jgi:hypothetical protein